MEAFSLDDALGGVEVIAAVEMTWWYYSKSDPLLPSGLLSPVEIIWDKGGPRSW
jgi:hypothetical protein